MIFPTSADKLSFSLLANHWSEESGASQKKLLTHLEAAWWVGEIRGNSDRLQLLKKIFEHRYELCLPVVFVTPDDEGPPVVTPGEAGGVLVDERPRIDILREVDNWTEQSCDEAFEALAKFPSQDYYPLFSLSIHFIDITREEFLDWIVKRGFDVPKFWKRNAEIDVRDATWHDGSTSSPYISSGPKFGGRGTKKRAIQLAFKTRFPNGDIPPGMTSEARNELIRDELKKTGLNRALPNERTIQRALKDLFGN